MKGQKTGGRQAGTPNKLTKTLKEAILASFDAVGGEEYLIGVAETDPKAYLALLGRVLPSEVKANLTASGTLADVIAASYRRTDTGPHAATEAG